MNRFFFQNMNGIPATFIEDYNLGYSCMLPLNLMCWCCCVHVHTGFKNYYYYITFSKLDRSSNTHKKKDALSSFSIYNFPNTTRWR